MSPSQQTEMNDRARAFIDSILEINKKHGMGSVISDDTYQRAVEGSANAFKGLVGPAPS